MADNRIEQVRDSLEEARIEENNAKNKETNEEEPVREITQTDHLNKKLLSAFLDRINTQSLPGDQSESRIEGDNKDVNDSDINEFEDEKPWI